jgi:hypothetical protein
MCVTCHFIDSDWNLHKRIINFSLIPNHKGDTIGEKLVSLVCLSRVLVAFLLSQLTMLVSMILLLSA